MCEPGVFGGMLELKKLNSLFADILASIPIYALEKMLANCLPKQRRHCISNLDVLLCFRTRKVEDVRERLDTRCFAHRNGALLIRMDKRSPMNVALGKYCAGHALPLHPTIALGVV